jgi:hypothetical protein
MTGAGSAKVLEPAQPTVAKREFELCIHIGHIKTATTWLQDTVFADPNSGFFTPWDRPRMLANAAFVMANCYYYDRDWARSLFEDGLRLAADDPRIPILSEEVLSGDPVRRLYMGRNIADRIHAVFPKARILIGVREQKSMAMSTYREYILAGGTLELEAYIGRGDELIGVLPILHPDYLEYDLIVGYYQGLYGAENVLVMPMECLKRDPGEYLRKLLEFCRSPGRIDSLAPPKHVGLSGFALDLRRRLNPLIEINPVTRKFTRTHVRINRLCRKVDKILPARQTSRRERRWDELLERRYAGCFRASNRRLSEMTGIDFGALGYDV